MDFVNTAITSYIKLLMNFALISTEKMPTISLGLQMKQRGTKGYKRNMIFVKYKKKMDYKHISDVGCFFDVIPYCPIQNKPEEFIHTVKFEVNL